MIPPQSSQQQHENNNNSNSNGTVVEQAVEKTTTITAIMTAITVVECWYLQMCQVWIVLVLGIQMTTTLN